MWTSLCTGVFSEIRETPRPGSAHADELETSLYLHLDESRVQMEEAVREIPERWSESKYFFLDLEQGSPVLFMDWWTRWNKSGVAGDATVATAEKGKALFEETIENLTELVEDFRNIPIAERTDYHAKGSGKARLVP